MAGSRSLRLRISVPLILQVHLSDVVVILVYNYISTAVGVLILVAISTTGRHFGVCFRSHGPLVQVLFKLTVDHDDWRDVGAILRLQAIEEIKQVPHLEVDHVKVWTLRVVASWLLVSLDVVLHQRLLVVDEPPLKILGVLRGRIVG